MNPVDREPALRMAWMGQVGTLVGLAGLGAVYVRALAFTPVERIQGPAQKIVYLHAPGAWAALMAFAVCGILSALYLGLRDMRLDRLAASSAEVGVVFSVVLLTTGPIYGRPVWGSWWEWDARLTSTLFIFLLFLGYMIMRGAVIDPDQRARFSAVIGILGLVLVPFIHLTVYMFRTIHPQPVIMKPSRPDMPGEMLTTFFMSIAVFTVMYLGFVTQRYAMAKLQAIREEEMFSDT